MIEIYKSKYSWRLVLDKKDIIESKRFRNHRKDIEKYGNISDYNNDINNAFYLNDIALGCFLMNAKLWKINYIWRLG